MRWRSTSHARHARRGGAFVVYRSGRVASSRGTAVCRRLAQSEPRGGAAGRHRASEDGGHRAAADFNRRPAVPVRRLGCRWRRSGEPRKRQLWRRPGREQARSSSQSNHKQQASAPTPTIRCSPSRCACPPPRSSGPSRRLFSRALSLASSPCRHRLSNRHQGRLGHREPRYFNRRRGPGKLGYSRPGASSRLSDEDSARIPGSGSSKRSCPPCAISTRRGCRSSSARRRACTGCGFAPRTRTARRRSNSPTSAHRARERAPSRHCSMRSRCFQSGSRPAPASPFQEFPRASRCRT